jgi:hypothetical protein
LVDLTDWLGPQQGRHFRLAPPLLPIDIEVFPLGFMVLICFLLVLKGVSLLVYLSLSKDAGLDVDLFLPRGVQINFDSIVPFPLVLVLVFFVDIGCIVQLILDFGI